MKPYAPPKILRIAVRPWSPTGRPAEASDKNVCAEELSEVETTVSRAALLLRHAVSKAA
jgi:hypothetical protein